MRCDFFIFLTVAIGAIVSAQPSRPIVFQILRINGLWWFWSDAMVKMQGRSLIQDEDVWLIFSAGFRRERGCPRGGKFSTYSPPHPDLIYDPFFSPDILLQLTTSRSHIWDFFPHLTTSRSHIWWWDMLSNKMKLIGKTIIDQCYWYALSDKLKLSTYFEEWRENQGFTCRPSGYL